MSTDATAHPEGLFEGADEKPVKKPRAKKAVLPQSGLPENLGKPVKVKVPDFANPKRPKTCLEVDFPIVPINALSALEGNAGKPIYQMSKWWARRRSSVFRAMLLAAAIEAPPRRHPDGTLVLDADGVPIPDETEAAKRVWDVYYANHQQAGNFRNLKVLDCFMGGGTTLVEGSRLGFQVAGVDLNPVAWFIVRNELSCPDPAEVKKLFDAVEAEVKPQIQPFYVTEEPDGRPGVWRDAATGEAVLVTVVGRTRANLVYDKFVEVAQAQFTGVDDVEVSWDRSFLRLLFDHKLSLRFKKLSKSLRSSNVRTNAQRTVYFQLELESFPPAPTEVTFGYVLDATGAKIERVCLTCPIGWSLLKWVIPVMEPPADSHSLFSRQPQPDPSAPVVDTVAQVAPPVVSPKRKKAKKAE